MIGQHDRGRFHQTRLLNLGKDVPDGRPHVNRFKNRPPLIGHAYEE